jgi:tight adherence protein B
LFFVLGVLLWSRGVDWRDVRPPAAGSRLLAEFDDFMRRSDVANPRSALSIWAFATGIVAFVCEARVGPAMAAVSFAVSASCFCLMLASCAQKRRQRIVRQLPAFLEDLVCLAGIGNSVQTAFQAAAASTQAPLSECLEQVMPRLHAGMDMDQALATAARISRVQEFELIGAVLRVSIRFDDRSNAMLERMAASMRDIEQSDREPVALPSGARPSSWMLGVVPAMLGSMVIVLNPEHVESLWADELGKQLVYSAIGVQAIGTCLLYRLARRHT